MALVHCLSDVKYGSYSKQEIHIEQFKSNVNVLLTIRFYLFPAIFKRVRVSSTFMTRNQVYFSQDFYSRGVTSG